MVSEIPPNTQASQPESLPESVRELLSKLLFANEQLDESNFESAVGSLLNLLLTQPEDVAFTDWRLQAQQVINDMRELTKTTPGNLADLVAWIAAEQKLGREAFPELSDEERGRRLTEYFPDPDSLHKLVQHVVDRYGLIADKMSRLLDVLRDEKPTEARLAAFNRQVVPLFKDGYALSPSNHPLLAAMRALESGATRRGWTDDDGARVPTHITKSRKGTYRTSVRAPDGELSPPPDVLVSLWQKVESMDDLTSDVLLICLAQCSAQVDGHNKPAVVTADSILDNRGIQRMRRADEPGNWSHGHRTEDRQQVGRALALLANIWLELSNVEIAPPKRGRSGRRLTLESPILLIRSRVTQSDLDGHDIFLAAHIQLGDWVLAYTEANMRYVGLFAQKAVTYDPYRHQVEKRLAKYLAFHFRENAASQRAAVKLKVRTLAESVGLKVDTDRPQRTRERLETALRNLAKDNVIASWSYAGDEPLPARGWINTWLERAVYLEAPQVLRERYASLGRKCRSEIAPA